RPLYYNDRYDFYALSRFEDVQKCSVDWATYVSSKGTVLELVKEIVKGSFQVPAGSIIFEDPPTHDLHRGLLARVFTPRRMKELERNVREFCAHSLYPLVVSGGFGFERGLVAPVPMPTHGMQHGTHAHDPEARRD